ncbi:GNAT family N-acetyltransferase [Nocardiopsis aegyptia]|uniref:GNAT family N-acetyltransferase n=1 Tax=Nocardiopsis aegyptia TaxID=220378 RepID=UPI00367273C1
MSLPRLSAPTATARPGRSRTGPLEVVSADRGAERSRFVRLPYRLNRGDPHWVPPLRSDVRRLLSPRGPFHEQGETALFLARRPGGPVGRIAAILDPVRTGPDGGPGGAFGLFACADDPEAASALTDAAAAWLRERGAAEMTGPYDLTINDECGTLIEGFDRPPAIMTAHNPPYHADLLRHAGFVKAKDLWSWELVVDDMRREWLTRLADRVERRTGATVRTVDFGSLPAEAERMRGLLNASLRDNWGSRDMGEREFHEHVRRLKPLLRPGMVVFVEVDGVPVGTGLLIPDVNPAIAAARGTLGPLSLLRVLRTARTTDRGRVAFMGVAEEYRRRGLHVLLTARLAEWSGIRRTELSWVLEDNTGMNTFLERLGSRRHRVHRIWRKAL